MDEPGPKLQARCRRSETVRAWLALLLLAPLAVAGSQDHPEITDAAGDSTAGIGDVTAAWFDPVSATEVDVHVAFAQLSEQDSVQVVATWAATGPFAGAPIAGYGAQAWITPSGDRARQILPADSNGPELILEVSYGSPGHIHIQDVWSGGLGWGGGTLTDFVVDVLAAAPTSGIQPVTITDEGTHDQAGPGASFTHELGGSGAWTPWNITGPLRVASPAETDIPGPVDLTGLWTQRNGTGFDLTARVRSMSPEEVAACGSLRAFVSLGGYNDGITVSGLSSLTFEDGWMVAQQDSHEGDVMRDFDTVGTVTFPYEVRWVLGTPGFFQLHAQEVDVDVAAAPRVTMRCGDLSDHLDPGVQLADVLAEGAPFLLPAFFAMVATIVGTAVVKNKKQRR